MGCHLVLQARDNAQELFWLQEHALLKGAGQTAMQLPSEGLAFSQRRTKLDG